MSETWRVRIAASPGCWEYFIDNMLLPRILKGQTLIVWVDPAREFSFYEERV